MSKWFGFVLVFLLATPLCAADDFQNNQQKLSYAIGMSIGSDMKRQGIDLDIEQLSAGLAAAYTGEDARLDPEEMVKVLTDYQQEMQQKKQAEAAAQAADNKEAGSAYQAENAKKDGVKTTSTGLQYEIIKPGTGATPSATDTVKVNYRGSLIDGTEFDSSYKRGQPATFEVGKVIPGWTEALQLMQEGGKMRLVIPPELAYGDRGAPPVIAPGSTLVFEVELVEIQQE